MSKECSSPTPWHGQTVEAIPEFFDKPGMVENLATAHPTLLVRQMANEILRLRSAPSEKSAPVAWQAKHPGEGSDWFETTKAVFESKAHGAYEYRELYAAPSTTRTPVAWRYVHKESRKETFSNQPPDRVLFSESYEITDLYE